MVNASLRCLNSVISEYLFQVSLLLIGQQSLGHFFSYRSFFPTGTQKGGWCFDKKKTAYHQLKKKCRLSPSKQKIKNEKMLTGTDATVL